MIFRTVIASVVIAITLAFAVPAQAQAPPVPPGPGQVITNIVAPTPAAKPPVKPVGSLTASQNIDQDRLRALGLRVTIKRPPGTSIVEFTIRRGCNLREATHVVARVYRTRPAGVLRLNDPVIKRLRPGCYILEVRAGTSKTRLGPVARIRFAVRP
jgi:hypothetical protein